MKLVDTFWEKENLGVDSAKLVVEERDSVEELQTLLEMTEKDYWEADVAPGNFDIVSYLETQGFHYMEVLMELRGSESDISVPQSMKRFTTRTVYERATEEELNTILEIVESGEMFLTDKISLNKRFGTEKAGRRYKNWVRSMLAKKAECYAIKYDSKLIGFEVIENKDGHVELCLGGGFPKACMGSGMMTVTASYHYWISKGVKSINTNVSSNNMPVLKLHELFGLKVSNMRYILIKNVG